MSQESLVELQIQEPYQSYLKIEDNSFSFSTLKTWLAWFFSNLFNNEVSFTFSQVLPYLIIIIMVVLIVLKIAGLSFSDLGKPKQKNISNNGFYNEDDSIHEADFIKLANEAIGLGDYRLAIRYTYLSLLQQLDNKGLIVWEKQKSNFDYLLTLKRSNFYNSFTNATRTYEDAWYGEMPWTDDIYQSKYESLSTEISNISNQIKA